MNQDNPKSTTNGWADTDMPLFSSYQKADDNMPLARQIVQFSDQLAEFVCINAFLCDAFTNMMEKQETMNDEIIRGALYCSESLKTRSFELKAIFEQVRTQCITEHE